MRICRSCGGKLSKKDLKYRDDGEHRDDTVCIKCKRKSNLL